MTRLEVYSEDDTLPSLHINRSNSHIITGRSYVAASATKEKCRHQCQAGLIAFMTHCFTAYRHDQPPLGASFRFSKTIYTRKEGDKVREAIDGSYPQIGFLLRGGDSHHY